MYAVFISVCVTRVSKDRSINGLTVISVLVWVIYSWPQCEVTPFVVYYYACYFIGWVANCITALATIHLSYCYTYCEHIWLSVKTVIGWHYLVLLVLLYFGL